jgi:hypothetical protein
MLTVLPPLGPKILSVLKMIFNFIFKWIIAEVTFWAKLRAVNAARGAVNGENGGVS